MKEYSQKFYENRHRNTLHAANAVLSVALDVLPAVRSAVDVGCGVGTWLSVLHARGITDILGVDGEWVDRNLLVIPTESFRHADLTKKLDVSRRFDMAISLEVAEHLPAACADDFVATLVRLADCVLFSAAIPRQGGTNHLNEQWPEYWAERFARHDYQVVDAIRSCVWDDPVISSWYKQNTLLYVKRERLPDLRNAGGAPFPKLSVVHPDLYLQKLRQKSMKRARSRVPAAVKSFVPRTVKNWIKRSLDG